MDTVKQYLPVFVFLCLGFFLWRSLSEDPRLIPTPLVNRAAPVFHAPNLFNPNEIITQKIFDSRVSIFNIFASWCPSCRAEHSVWIDFHHQHPGIMLIGVLFKDKAHLAKQFLKTSGNPYDTVINDENGDIAIDYGVYGVPETYVMDQKGIIRLKIPGVVTPEILDQKILPLLKKLSETSV